MCSPLAIGLISGVTSGMQAIAQYSAQKEEYANNKASSEQAWRDQQDQITQRTLQEQDALHQKEAKLNIEQAQAEAETAVSGAASGVQGISMDNLLQDVTRRASSNRETEKTNTDMIIGQLRLQRKGVNSEAVSRINSVSKPSALGLLASLGSAGVSGYNSYISAKNKLL